MPLTNYRARTLAIIRRTLGEVTVPAALDFGSGDGWFARELVLGGICPRVTAVEVVLRPKVLTRPVLFDGYRLPFADHQFPLVYAVDVLHHCPDPLVCLTEMCRCSSEYVLLKDHTYDSKMAYCALCMLDEVGNRRVGIRSVYNYQRGWSWNTTLAANGFRRVALQWPSCVHAGLLGRLTNKLQFVALWRRVQRS